jgi:hypothetical protein
MKTKASICVIVLTLAALVFPCAGYGSILLDPDGPGPLGSYLVSALDFLPGNALDSGAVSSPGSFTQYYQARLGSLLDSDGNVIAVPGLNSPSGFQITVVAGFAASGAWNGGVLTAGQTGGAAFVKIYEHSATPSQSDALTASDLTGAGFTDGTLIYSGNVHDASIVFMRTGSGTATFDQFGGNDYPGLTTISGIGGFYAASDAVNVNPNYFSDGASLAGLELDSSGALAFKQANPSAQFVDGAGNAVAPALGSVNGTSGPDLQVQADSNASFRSIPEPATLALLAAGVLALLRRKSHRTFNAQYSTFNH